MIPNSVQSQTKGKVAKTFVTSFEAAKMLGVTLRTIQLWADGGLLECWKTSGGHRRIARESVERLLQVRPAPESAGETGLHDRTEHSPERLRILVVDDEADILRLYRMQLARWQLAPHVTVAANGYEGLVLLGSTQPHMLITDLHMPEMDGFQMLRILRTLSQVDATEIVVVTGLDPEEIAARGGLPSGVATIKKPIPFAELEKIATRIAASSGCLIGTGATG